MFKAFGSVVLLLLALSWPEVAVGQTIERRSVSRFYQPSEGVFYRYGNFCGPQFPRFPVGLSREQRIEFAAGIDPIDSIDWACKWHDLCYEFNGHDSGDCDHDFSLVLRRDEQGVLNHRDWEGDIEWARACNNLAHEMALAVGFLKTNDEPFANRAWRRAITTAFCPVFCLSGVVQGLPADMSGCWRRREAFLGNMGMMVPHARPGARVRNYDNSP